MRARTNSAPVRVGGLAALVALVAVLCVASAAFVLVLAPALALAAALLLGFTPGEGLIARLRARRVRRPVPRAPRRLGAPTTIVLLRPTTLAASPLAMRPPPGAPAICC